MNSQKIILDLCGGTGAWSRPYKEAGYDVRVITLPQHDVSKVYFFSENIVFVGNGVSGINVPYNDIYGILAAPPCTEFSVAKGNRPRNLADSMKIVEACLQIIWKCRLFGNLKFWALENPGRNGLLRQFLGIPPWEFEQWEFGGDQIKRTGIWGYYKIPKATVTIRPADITLRHNPCGSANGRNWGKRVYPPEYADYINGLHGYTAQRAAARAITPAGFAQAFFRANK